MSTEPNPPAEPSAEADDAMSAAIKLGDYAAAYDAFQATPDAATPLGAAAGAFLLALIERYDEAERLVAVSNLQGFEVIVRGARQRTARWSDPAAGGGLSTVTQSPRAALHAQLAVAFQDRDAVLAERAKAELAKLARPLPGKLTFVDGTTQAFTDLTDCDDAIGQMFETYCGEGLLYFPFDAIERIDLLPRINFMDFLLPKAKITTARGPVRAYVPLLYAGSTALAQPAEIRNGTLTVLESLGSARRGRGQHNWRHDRGIARMTDVAAIEFTPLA